MSEAAQKKMWGGRFEAPPNAEFFEFEQSFHFDRRLLPFELRLDRAWAHQLEKLKILAPDETSRMISALDEIEKRAKKDATWLEESNAEDVHHFVELNLVATLGPLGQKLHTGRSRNEMVVTEFRMYIKTAAAEMRASVCELIAAILGQAEKHLGIPMPGMTHMQPAQPILLSYFLLAHAEAFFHDLDRIAFAANTADACPLGSGALAGCAFPIDRRALADELGFARVTRNSLDSVSRRDFPLDYLFSLSVLASHLSRLAEDMILFAAPAFGFVILPDEYSTGSSLMPQKKNPDAWELIRGKSGRIVGALAGMFTMLKGLPTSYQRDLQEDKESLFDAHDHALAMTRIAAGAIAATKFNEEKLRAAASDVPLLMTDAADYLVRKGVPFREAHEIIGRLVREAEMRKISVTQMPVAELKKFSAAFDTDVFAALTLENSLVRRNLAGGTGAEAVRESLADARARLTKEKGEA